MIMKLMRTYYLHYFIWIPDNKIIDLIDINMRRNIIDEFGNTSLDFIDYHMTKRTPIFVFGNSIRFEEIHVTLTLKRDKDFEDCEKRLKIGL